MAATVLIVEDDEITRSLTQRFLKQYGFEVLVATDGDSAVAASKSCPDVILMDLGLPGLDGFEATRRLKADAVTGRIPVIALTASAGSDEVIKALEVGFDDYITKPVSVPRLISKIESVLGTIE
jgi:CheY-like chemotaxis protein